MRRTTSAPPLTSLAELCREPARQRPLAPACRCQGWTTDYATLDRHADQVANGLISAGVGPGDRIAVMSRNSTAYLELVLGAIRARATLVAVNWRLAAPEVAYVLDHAGARAVFVEAPFRDVAGPAMAGLRPAPPLWVIDDQPGSVGAFAAWRDGQATRSPGLAADLDDDVVQMYTSGTTGRPKGVCLSHRNYLACFEQIAAFDWGRLDPDEVVFAPSPFFHVSGMNAALRTLARGACVVTAPTFRPDELPALIEAERINRTTMVPAVIDLCVSAGNAATTDYSSLRTITYGGSPITQDLLRRARDTLGCEFVQGYGLTETTGVATFLTPEDHDPARGKLASCGRGVPGVAVRVVAPDGSDCEPGNVGEVLIRGPNLMRGYWRDPDATAAAIRDGWLHTGDAGYLDNDGYLYIHDRIKDMIVSGGENVYPAEVENALADHPQVADVAVIGVPDPRWGEAVMALVVPRGEPAPDPAALLAFARSRIAGYKVPKRIDFVTELPRNASGKILRRELRAPFWAGHERLVN